MSHEDVVYLEPKPKPATTPRYPRPPKPPRLAVSVPEAAESLGISVGLLYKEISAGRIRVVKVAGRTLVPVSELTRIIGGKP
jgi:excisionase family DNA binding protein